MMGVRGLTPAGSPSKYFARLVSLGDGGKGVKGNRYYGFLAANTTRKPKSL